jgi:tetratricopeptide (TPR) repeat protein
MRYLNSILPFILAFSLAVCKTAPPAQISGAQEARVANPAEHRKAQEWLNRASREFSENKFDQSLASTRESLKIEESFEALFLEGNNLMKLGEHDDALRPYLRAEELRPNDEQLGLFLAMLYTSRGQLPEAQKRYLRLRQAYPKEPLYAFKAGTTYKLLRDYPNALGALKEADVPSFAEKDQLYLQLGDVCVEMKRYEEADAYFKKAQAANPRLRDAQSGQAAGKTAQFLESGNSLFRQKRYAEALDQFNLAKKESPDSSAPYFLAASAEFALQRYADSEASLNSLLKKSPDHTDGVLLLSSVYQKTGRPAQAEKLIRAEIAKSPGNAELYNRLGIVQKDQGHVRQSIESFHKSLSLSATYLPARINLAGAYLDDGRFADAEREYERASAQDPGNADLANGRQLVRVYRTLDQGDRLFRARKFDAAIAEYTKALAVKDDMPVIHNSIARSEYERGNLAAAEGRYKKTLGYDASNTQAMVGLVRIYRRKKDAAQERLYTARLNEVVAKDPARAVELGRLKEETDPKDAENFYTGLLKKNPDDVLVKRRLAALYYKMALEEGKREKYESARALLRKSKDLAEVQGADEALATIEDNIAHAPLLPALKRAEGFYSRGNFAEALPIYEQTYQKWPRSLILVKIASCKMEMGRKEEALRTLNDAAEKKPEDLELTEAVFTYYLNQGELSRAEKGFDGILSQHEDAYYSLYKRGIIEIQKKEYPRAQEFFDRALIYRPEFVEARIARGVAKYQAGQRDSARRDFEEAMNEKSEIGALNLGMVHFNDNMIDQAQKIFLDLEKKFPDYPDVHYHLSFIYYSKGDLDMAEQKIEEARKLRNDPEDVAAHARILEKRYETSKSPETAARIRELYRTILTRYPASVRAKEARTNLAKLEGASSPVLMPVAGSEGKILDPVVAENRIMIAENKSLTAVEAGSGRVLWRKFFAQPVSSMAVSQSLLVIAGTELSIVDLEDGGVLRKSDVEAGSRVLADADSILIAGPKTVQLITLTDRQAMAQSPAGARYFITGGSIYRVLQSGLIERLDRRLVVEASSKPLRGVLDVRRLEDELFVLRAGELVILDKGLSQARSIALPAGTDRLGTGSGRIAAFSRTQVLIMDADGDKEGALRGADIRAVRLLADGRAVLLDGTEVRLVDKEGKAIWKGQAQGAKVHSLYY